MTEDFVEYVENDTSPALYITYASTDVSAFTLLQLSLKYDTYPVKIAGTVDSLDHTSFSFKFLQRVTGVLSSAANAGDVVAQVTVTGAGQTFATLPAAGEIVIDGESVLYSSKTGTGTLNLASPLKSSHLIGAKFEKPPDLRAGTWPAQVKTTDSSGNTITFTGFNFKIDSEEDL